MSEMQDRKFGYVVHHCMPPFPPPGPIPPGMTVKDWTDYINSYVDVRARQIYDKLKDLVKEGSFDVGIQSVTYTPESNIGRKTKRIGRLTVDGQVTEVNAEDPTGTVFDELLLKDDSTGQVYKLYIKNGTLESQEYDS